MRLLILGLNHAPEQVGIGPYTAEMAAALAARGHSVEIVTAKPYYPEWRTNAAFAGGGYRRSVENGVTLTRCPIYVPETPRGARRIVHHLSFGVSSLLPMIRAARRMHPDVVMTVAPSMIAAPVARFCARLAGARSWLHIQDFEVGAAFATGLIDPKSMIGRTALLFEHFAYGGFDMYSSISPQMCARLEAMEIRSDRIVEFRNWADIDRLKPMPGPSPYRREWDVSAPHVALYSGNIANKQGIDILLQAAHALKHRNDLEFHICGEGPNKASLVKNASDLPNVHFHPLQPRERLNELLALADVHLLPQLAGAADLVLPSKLTNMLASGRPIVATAAPGTGLAGEVEGCGLVAPPGDGEAMAAAIERIIDDRAMASTFGAAARARAEFRWSKAAILDRLDAELQKLADAPY